MLELEPGALITSDFSLQLYTSFYENLQCEWDNLSLSDNCELDPEPGPCFAAIEIFYFNEETGMCEEFIWGGCNGVVPFSTLEECQDACGEIVLDEVDSSKKLTQEIRMRERELSIYMRNRRLRLEKV